MQSQPRSQAQNLAQETAEAAEAAGFASATVQMSRAVATRFHSHQVQPQLQRQRFLLVWRPWVCEVGP